MKFKEKNGKYYIDEEEFKENTFYSTLKQLRLLKDYKTVRNSFSFAKEFELEINREKNEIIIKADDYKNKTKINNNYFTNLEKHLFNPKSILEVKIAQETSTKNTLIDEYIEDNEYFNIFELDSSIKKENISFEEDNNNYYLKINGELISEIKKKGKLSCRLKNSILTIKQRLT